MSRTQVIATYNFVIDMAFDDGFEQSLDLKHVTIEAATKRAANLAAPGVEVKLLLNGVVQAAF